MDDLTGPSGRKILQYQQFKNLKISKIARQIRIIKDWKKEATIKECIGIMNYDLTFFSVFLISPLISFFLYFASGVYLKIVGGGTTRVYLKILFLLVTQNKFLR